MNWKKFSRSHRDSQKPRRPGHTAPNSNLYHRIRCPPCRSFLDQVDLEHRPGGCGMFASQGKPLQHWICLVRLLFRLLWDSPKLQRKDVDLLRNTMFRPPHNNGVASARKILPQYQGLRHCRSPKLDTLATNGHLGPLYKPSTRGLTQNQGQPPNIEWLLGR